MNFTQIKKLISLKRRSGAGIQTVDEFKELGCRAGGRIVVNLADREVPRGGRGADGEHGGGDCGPGAIAESTGLEPGACVE